MAGALGKAEMSFLCQIVHALRCEAADGRGQQFGEIRHFDFFWDFRFGQLGGFLVLLMPEERRPGLLGPIRRPLRLARPRFPSALRSFQAHRKAVRAVDRWEASGLPQRVSRVRTDNKLDRHEWLRAPGGRLLKTDALDHHQAHDLIGCQAVEWDVAAAITEFGLDDAEAAGLIAATDCLIDPRLLQFYRLAYSAFRVGQAALQARSDPEVERRAEQLRGLLHQHVCGETRHESLVG